MVGSCALESIILGHHPTTSDDSTVGRRTKRRAGKSPRSRPDAHFSAGPLEFARFGNVMMSRSHATHEQWRALMTDMAAGLPDLVAKIDSLVDRIAVRVARLPPEILLQRAWWDLSALMILSDQK